MYMRGYNSQYRKEGESKKGHKYTISPTMLSERPAATKNNWSKEYSTIVSTGAAIELCHGGLNKT